DPARAVRNLRGVMNTFDDPKAATGAKRPKTNGKSTGSVAALDHRHILASLRALKRGDFSAKMRDDLTGVEGQICETFNELVDMVKTIREEANDVTLAVGKQGQAAKRMRRFSLSGGWADYVTSVNEVISDLT